MLADVRLSNGGSPFAGDNAHLTTVSPNGDGFRDRIEIHLRLTQRVVVQPVLVWGKPDAGQLYGEARSLAAGDDTISWTLPPTTLPRTYRIELLAWDVDGHSSSYGLGPEETAVVRVQGVDAGFRRDSYRPGALASLAIATDATRLTLQLYRSGPEHTPTNANDELEGLAVDAPRALDWREWRSRPHLVTVQIPRLASGFYYARLSSPDGRVGYAPFVVSPLRLGESRVAVVLPTFTWQAYNFQDENGDGVGDSWYADPSQRSVLLGRPYLERGVPLCFRRYDLPFLHWLAWSGKKVDYLADSDLEAVSTAEELARDYDLIVFPGHEEYVTQHQYDLISGYRDLGGHLLFLFANSFFRRVNLGGDRLQLIGLWRDLGRPEAALIGVQYRANDEGGHRAPWVVRDEAGEPWLYAGTGLKNGSKFGMGGIEIDAKAASSPRDTHVVADIPDLYGPGITAQMTYYQTPAGAKVFAAGAFGFAGAAYDPPVSSLLANLWHRLSKS